LGVPLPQIAGPAPAVETTTTPVAQPANQPSPLTTVDPKATTADPAERPSTKAKPPTVDEAF